jgi:hypothetical protein
MFEFRNASKRVIKGLIDSGQLQEREMIEAALTPAYTNIFEIPLNQPLSGAFHHVRAQGSLNLLKDLMLDYDANVAENRPAPALRWLTQSLERCRCRAA